MSWMLTVQSGESSSVVLPDGLIPDASLCFSIVMCNHSILLYFHPQICVN